MCWRALRSHHLWLYSHSLMRLAACPEQPTRCTACKSFCWMSVSAVHNSMLNHHVRNTQKLCTAGLSLRVHLRHLCARLTLSHRDGADVILIAESMPHSGRAERC